MENPKYSPLEGDEPRGMDPLEAEISLGMGNSVKINRPADLENDLIRSYEDLGPIPPEVGIIVDDSL